jgi:hypothetical protein
VFDDAVRPGVHECLVAVRIAHHVGRCAVRAAHFDDLPKLIRIADVFSVDV